MGLPALGEQPHQYADQDRSRDVDHERAQRKTAAVLGHDPRACQMASQAAKPGASEDGEIFVQARSSPSICRYCKNRLAGGGCQHTHSDATVGVIGHRGTAARAVRDGIERTPPLTALPLSLYA